MNEHRAESPWRCECASCVKERKTEPAERLRVREAQRERRRRRLRQASVQRPQTVRCHRTKAHAPHLHVIDRHEYWCPGVHEPAVAGGTVEGSPIDAPSATAVLTTSHLPTES